MGLSGNTQGRHPYKNKQAIHPELAIAKVSTPLFAFGGESIRVLKGKISGVCCVEAVGLGKLEKAN